MNIVYSILVYIVWFLATYYSVLFLLSIFTYRKSIFEGKKVIHSNNPKVSIVIPAYNEEDSIKDTIASLKQVTYKNVEFIVINDGSKDKTSQYVNESIVGDSRFKFIDRKINKNKANSLNEGIDNAKGEYIACMDADSIIEPGIIEKVLPYFSSKKIGAVTVSVEVHKPKSFLHKVFHIEFNLGLSLFLKIFSFYDAIFVTPGPFSMYQKSMLKKIGGFNPNNITEDHEIAYRIHKYGYKIKNCIEAKVSTILPATFKELYIQRRRWYSGAIQSFFQHKDMHFKSKYGLFAFFTPFNLSLIYLGLILITCSLFMSISRLVDNIGYHSYTNFNFFSHLSFNFDILEFSRINIFGATMLVFTISFLFIGLHMVKKKYRDNKLGMLGFPFLFLLYQIYWAGATWAIIKGKKISWR